MGNNNGRSSKKKSNYISPFPQKIELKIHLVGDACTGKTCVSLVHEDGVYRGLATPKNCTRIYRKNLTVHNIATNVFIWDHPGYERYRKLASIQIPYADGILLFYDVMQTDTFLHLPEWLKYLRSLNPGAIIFIVGAMSYERFGGKQVSRETGLKFARSENLEFIECFAETGENVNYIFEHMAVRLLQKKGVVLSDKVETEGKSHEYKDTKEKLNYVVSEKGIVCASIKEKNLSTSITKKEIFKIEEKTIPVEDAPKFLKEGKLFSERETECLELKKVDNIDVTKRNDTISSQSNKDTPSELNEDRNSLDNPKTVLPETKKFALSEEEMQLEGRCPAWIA